MGIPPASLKIYTELCISSVVTVTCLTNKADPYSITRHFRQEEARVLNLSGRHAFGMICARMGSYAEFEGSVYANYLGMWSSGGETGVILLFDACGCTREPSVLLMDALDCL